MSFWDIPAGLIIAFMVIGGFLYGLRQNERGILLVASAFMFAIVAWRVNAWYETTDSYAHQTVIDTDRHAESLYAKYGITPVNHQ